MPENESNFVAQLSTSNLKGLPSSASPPALYFATGLWTPDGATVTVYAVTEGTDAVRAVRRLANIFTSWPDADKDPAAWVWADCVWSGWQDAARDEVLLNEGMWLDSACGHTIIPEAPGQHSRQVTSLLRVMLESPELGAGATKGGQRLQDVLRRARMAAGRKGPVN